MANPQPSRQEQSRELASADLLRQCGVRLTDEVVWEEFQRRFQRRLLLYLLRAGRASGGGGGDIQDVLLDLAQEVYLRLIRNDGRALQGFRGQTEFAVRAFLARTASRVVSDYYRYKSAPNRKAQVISIEEAKEKIERQSLDSAGSDPGSVASLLSWIDVERVLTSDEDSRNAARNLLIFKLHHIDGFTAKELASFPVFDLSVSGVEAVLNMLRTRLRK